MYSTARAEPKCEWLDTRESSALDSRGLEPSIERAVTRVIVIARHARVLVRNAITLRTGGRSRNTRSLDDERAREFNGVHKRHGSSRIPSKLYA